MSGCSAPSTQAGYRTGSDSRATLPAMGCGCKGGRSKPDAGNQARQAKQAERRAAVDAAREAIANGAVPTVTRR